MTANGEKKGGKSTPSQSSGTIVALPPLPPKDGTPTNLPPATPPEIISSDPNALLDTIDSFGRRPPHSLLDTATTANTTTTTINTNNSKDNTFDPIEFLNHHFHTESTLLPALNPLLQTLTTRILTLDDQISSAIQRQAHTSDTTAHNVRIAKLAIANLEKRVTLVQNKALISERAVLDITRDMKRLDHAKKHLSRTITALKRLHMLLHAASQLHAATYVVDVKGVGGGYPEYRVAAHLIDATRLLLSHFDGYMGSVVKMREVRDAVGKMRLDLRDGIVEGFRVVGFGFAVCLERGWVTLKEGQELPPSAAGASRVGSGQAKDSDGNASSPKRNAGAINQRREGEDNSGSPDNNGEEDQGEEDLQGNYPPPPMTAQIMCDACLVIEALGVPTRVEFISSFCNDHLEPYKNLFDPTIVGMPKKKSSSPSKPTFKIKSLVDTSSSTTDPSSSDSGDANPHTLDQIDRRYSWYRRTLRTLCTTFRNVFPLHWNLYHALVLQFLNMTSSHLLSLLTAGKPCRDKDVEKVDVLLKALQKTLLFEKEMMAWLVRECGTTFQSVDGGGGNSKGKKNKGGAFPEGTVVRDFDNASNDVLGADGETLEFDEDGKAVAAGSAEGIRIKYERKLKARGNAKETGYSDHNDPSDGGGVGATGPDGPQKPPPVRPLLGVASSSFDSFMGPYIKLEEQNMNEQLAESATDKTVDSRGELPVFTSSTSLFIYMKNSITRCTALTKGDTFFRLYKAFKETLKKYAQVLRNKFPGGSISSGVTSGSALAVANLVSGSLSGATGGGGGTKDANPSSTITAAVSGVVSGASSSTKIPPGEEVTICHVIDTCEYCADTIEALEELIKSTISSPYKSKIDMNSEQEAFYDVTARGVRVLVSGLEQRIEAAWKQMASGTNWATLNVVGEESQYVRMIHKEVEPFVVTVKGLVPTSYFKNFCDRFASAFGKAYYNALLKLKKISHFGTQQLLLDVYNIKTLFLKLPVLEKPVKSSSSSSAPTTLASPTIPPAMYTKMITTHFQRIEILLKLVGTPFEHLIEMFKSQWPNGSSLELQTVMNLKGMTRKEQASLLEKFGVDSATAMKAVSVGGVGGVGGGERAVSVAESVQALQDKGSEVTARVNSDLNKMREKVDDFRKAFR